MLKRQVPYTIVWCCACVLAADEMQSKEENRQNGRAPEGAVVVVTTSMPVEPLMTVTDPKAPTQPIPAHDGAEYLKTIPGFSVIRKGGTDGDPVLRGMAGSRLNILLDGEQILGGCGMRMDPPTAYVFPESYDTIRVIKGPQSVIHGPGTSAGTVLFERGAERLEKAGSVGTASFTGGSFGRIDGVVDAKGGTPDFYVRGTGARSHSGDYEDGRGRAIHSKYTRWSANAALGWTPSDKTRLEVTTARSDGEAAYADRTMDGAKFLRENVGLKFETRELAPTLEKLSFQVYRNYIDHIMDNYSLRTFVPSMSTPEPSANNPDRTTRGGRFALTFRVAEVTKLVLGTDLQTNIHTLRTSMKQVSMPVESLPRVEDARFRNVGVFGEMTQPVSDRDQLIAGIRADRWHAEDRRTQVALSMMTKVANPTFQLNRDKTLTSGFFRFERHFAAPQVTAYAGIGHTERFPDYWELIKQESLTSVSAFGTNPERTTQLDLGFVQQEGVMRTSISLFYSRVHDFILIQSNVDKPALLGTRLATVTCNVDAKTWGGEWTLAQDLSREVKVEASLAYTRGENMTEDRPLAQIPPLETRLGLGYDNRIWSIGGLVRIVARQNRVALNQGNIVGQDLGPTGGFAVYSLNGGWKPAKWLFLTAGVDNLFNRDYAEHISRNASQVPGFAVQATRVNEPGRILWFKASCRWN